ncbi:helicase associated domain-containing protein [Streptomyces sp. NPDC059278]|uniref:helicase associated domain-containing protein n=1 Tax=Streptomyces sp. NPDC059278 TaxID=3346801 RepID=UPI0036BCEA42
MIDTERQDWARGWAALKGFVEREGHARVPYEHREGAFPLGQWVAEQRRAFGAGQMTGVRARRLEKLGMAWSAADARFQENLAAARVYFEEHWTLYAPRSGGGAGQAGGTVAVQPAPTGRAVRTPGVGGRAPGRGRGLEPRVAGGVAAALRRAARTGA